MELTHYIFPGIFSFTFTLLLLHFAVRLFPKWKLLDRPHKYGLNRAPIPYYGGLLIFIAVVVSVLVFVPLTKAVIALLIGGVMIAGIGFLDDLLGVNPFIRLLIQFLAGCVLVLGGVYIFTVNIPFWGLLDLDQTLIQVGWLGVGTIFPLLSAVFTIVWVMTVLNTMNFIDGISGLSSGVGFMAAFAIFILSIHPGIHSDPSSQIGVATIALIVALVSLAFLIFDFPRPKILMGDTGSTFLGFLIAVLAIFSGGKVATAFLVLGIPIMDMIWVVLRRTYQKRKFWHGDLKHLHHRLLDLGFSESRVVLLYLCITAVLGISAVSFVSSQQKFFIIIGLVVMMILLAGALVFLPRKK